VAFSDQAACLDPTENWEAFPDLALSWVAFPCLPWKEEAFLVQVLNLAAFLDQAWN